MKSVLVIGSTGMLGSAVTKYLSAKQLNVVESNREGLPVVAENDSIKFDILKDDLKKLFSKKMDFDYIINCAGLIKHKIPGDDFDTIFAAFKINSIFPQQLGNLLSQDTKVIQIGTDCVYDGLDGHYLENSVQSATDIYGVSKREGEVLSKNFMILRCSVVGRELESNLELMDWLLGTEPNGEVFGYVDHFWNGLTTLDFAKVVFGVIKGENFIPGRHHLVPRDQVSKFELLTLIAQSFGRKDISIKPKESGAPIDRTLGTLHPEINESLWREAAYSEPPKIADMLAEYACWLKGNP